MRKILYTTTILSALALGAAPSMAGDLSAGGSDTGTSAQTLPAPAGTEAPSGTDATTTGDIGASGSLDSETLSTLVGSTVVTSDGETVGTIADAGASAEGEGTFTVELDEAVGSGGETAEFPISLASAGAGGEVELDATMDEVKAQIEAGGSAGSGSTMDSGGATDSGSTAN